jgi:hypothetical protein
MVRDRLCYHHLYRSGSPPRGPAICAPAACSPRWQSGSMSAKSDAPSGAVARQRVLKRTYGLRPYVGQQPRKGKRSARPAGRVVCVSHTAFEVQEAKASWSSVAASFAGSRRPGPRLRLFDEIRKRSEEPPERVGVRPSGSIRGGSPEAPGNRSTDGNCQGCPPVKVAEAPLLMGRTLHQVENSLPPNGSAAPS